MALWSHWKAGKKDASTSKSVASSPEELKSERSTLLEPEQSQKGQTALSGTGRVGKPSYLLVYKAPWLLDSSSEVSLAWPLEQKTKKPKTGTPDPMLPHPQGLS